MGKRISDLAGIFDDLTGALLSIFARDAGGGSPSSIAALSGAQVSAVQAGGRVIVQNAATPEGADRTLTEQDAGAVLLCAANRSFTVPPGMPLTFGPAAYGAGVVTWVAGAGVTIVDDRTTGATAPGCALLCWDLNVYHVRGGKA